ncbi:unnamed protein product [Vitrella brassicaformis CCMP3155]|uniref:Carbohydrate binding module family 25 domain-containing protein n=1 Tax=Vitrella brassicaformis (strain CCMP3155) TaxID=1169540 RepID=A0A0G4FCH0_VITBC|nr:unnamed protein product [Vitrella brassicaformis CCMP3155]|eukprot:CEM10919.1 unnamed protein product [Vitrella brassicaformis CCMP3155]
MCDASHTEWDNPPSLTGKLNYSATADGVYLLQDGRLDVLRCNVDYVDRLCILDKAARGVAEAHLLYFTGWTSPRIHFQKPTDGRWTDPPGIVCNAFSDRCVWHAQMPFHSRLEFVLNDGSGSWDHAPGGGNYVLRGAGLYLLVDGEILRPESLRHHRQDLLQSVVPDLRAALAEASAGPFVTPSAAVSPTASDTTRATERASERACRPAPHHPARLPHRLHTQRPGQPTPHPTSPPDQPTASRTAEAQQAEAQQATFDLAAPWQQDHDTRDLQRPGLHLYYTLKSGNSGNSNSSASSSGNSSSNNNSSSNGNSEQMQLKCEYVVGFIGSDPSKHRLDSKECLQLTNELWYGHVEQKSMCFVMGITEGGREKEWDAPVGTDGKQGYDSIEQEGVHLLNEGVVHTLWCEDMIAREACLDILSLLDKEAKTAKRAHILYTTSWMYPRCHYRRADEISDSGVREEKWTLSPGVRCEGVPEGGGDLFHVSMAWHENLRVLFNDGDRRRAAWDHPQDGSGAYLIPSPGFYIISQGCMYSASTFNAAEDGLLRRIYQLLEAKTADMAAADEHREAQAELRALASRLSTVRSQESRPSERSDRRHHIGD